MNDIKGDDPKITLYYHKKHDNERIQIYEDERGYIYLKDGHFYRGFYIDENGHLESRCVSHLETKVKLIRR